MKKLIKPKKDDTKINSDSNNTANNVGTSGNIETQGVKEDTSLDDAFKQFENNVGEFTPETGEQIPQEQVNEGETKTEVSPTLEQQIKIKMFVGFACFVLSGLNTFILNKVRKTKVPTEKMFLTEPERDTILPYMNSVEVLNFIDKMPTWLIAVCHIEYLYFNKHSMYVEEYKLTKEEIEETKKPKTKKK